MFLATVRADGSPRLHPVVPVLVDGQVFVAIADSSPKWRDLARDPRCVLHALPGERDDEFALRGRAVERPDALRAVRAAARHQIHVDDHLVALDIERADWGWWEHVGEPDTYAVRYRWRPGRAVERTEGTPRGPAS